MLLLPFTNMVKGVSLDNVVELPATADLNVSTEPTEEAFTQVCH